MLAKKEIQVFISTKASSLKVIEPAVSSKSSPVWDHFNHIFVNEVKQEHVICKQCEDILVYKHSSGTNSLSKHIRSCRKDKTLASSIQLNVDRYCSSSKDEPPIPNRIREPIKVACAEFAILDSRPFRITQGKGFKNLAQKIFDAGKYLPISKDINVEKLLPHPTTVSRYIDSLYEQKHQQLILICEKLLVYTVVVDFWKDSYTGIQYCGISLHYINDWKLYCFVLGCYHYNLESSSAINTRKFVESKLAQYNLVLNENVFVVSDNEPKMLAAFRSECKRIGCSCHYINKQLEHTFVKTEIDKTPVQCDLAQSLFENVKKLVAYLRKSHKQTSMSKRVQIYSDTRFNGAYHMLKIFSEIFDEIGLVLSQENLRDYLALDKELLDQICSFLLVFDRVIEELSNDKRPTIYKVLPLRQRLLKECEMKSDDNDGLKQIKVFLLRRLESVWVLQDIHYISSLLHPSLKLFHNAPHEKAKAVELVKGELLKHQPSMSSGSSIINLASSCSSNTSTVSKPQQLTPTTQNILLQCFDVPSPEYPVSLSSPDVELEQYLSSNVTIKPEDDVLLYWKDHESIYPTLALIVKNIYSIPASNTTVERLFSAAGNTISDRRTKLNVEKVNKLLFLNRNLLILKELDQGLDTQEKRKLNSISLSLSGTNNLNVIDDEDGENFLSSSTSKKARTVDGNQPNDVEVIDELEDY